MKDTYSYKGWLQSDYLYKRCLAVVGYLFLGYVLTGLALVIIIITIIYYIPPVGF